LNVGTLTYGLAGTGDQDFAIKSRVVEGYTYTTEEYDLMNKETRNAVYESGTMRNDEGEQSEALFDFVKVQPGNDLVHFITLEAATGPMLLYTLHNILNTGKYGARETRTGRNIRNEILGVILGDHDTSLSTGEFLLEYHDESDDLEASIGEYISSVVGLTGKCMEKSMVVTRSQSGTNGWKQSPVGRQAMLTRCSVRSLRS